MVCYTHSPQIKESMVIQRLLQTLLAISVLLFSNEVKLEQAEASETLPVLQWCLDNYPNRHNYPPTGQPYGPTVDLMQELARRSGFKLAFSQNTPFARCLKLMHDGKTDLMIRLNYSDERNSYMHLIPHMRAARAEHLYIRQAQKDITDIAELNGLIIGVIRGYTYNSAALNLLKQNRKNIIEIETEETAIAMLYYRRIDVLIAPAQEMGQLIGSTLMLKDVIKEASLSFSLTHTDQIHIALSRNSPHAGLVKQLQTAVEQMAREGVLQQYYQLEMEPQH
jgi:polar amino acid transport system substrate-binding protein